MKRKAINILLSAEDLLAERRRAWALGHRKNRAPSLRQQLGRRYVQMMRILENGSAKNVEKWCRQRKNVSSKKICMQITRQVTVSSTVKNVRKEQSSKLIWLIMWEWCTKKSKCVHGKCFDKPITYPNLKGLEKHYKAHANVKCDSCNKIFSAKRNFKKHKECP